MTEKMRDKVPLLAGRRVEVIVKDTSGVKTGKSKYPLKGSVRKYDKPFDSVASSDWQLLK